MLSENSQYQTPRATRPASVQIKGRNLKYAIGPDMPRYWCDDDPWLTHFMNALSITFPHGERKFIESVKAVRDRVKNPATLADVAGFIAQEALHSREHSALNDALGQQGYGIALLEDEFGALMKRRGQKESKKTALAMTAAVEHLTALFGRALLTDERIRAMMHPDVRPMWTWHALEEIEHKAVAFDVYQDVFNDNFTRRLALLAATFGFFTFTHYAQYELLKQDGLANKPALWFKGLWRMWGPKGLVRQTVPAWLDYFRRDFHPWQEDDSPLIKQFERAIEPRSAGAV